MAPSSVALVAALILALARGSPVAENVTTAASNQVSIASTAISSTAPPPTRFCEFLNETTPGAAGERVECEPAESAEKRTHCFALWNATRPHRATMKGCFTDNRDCYDRAACVDESAAPKSGFLFCCCVGDMCNAAYEWRPRAVDPTRRPHDDDEGKKKEVAAEARGGALEFALWTILVAAILLTVVCGSVYLYRARFGKDKASRLLDDGGGAPGSPSPLGAPPSDGDGGAPRMPIALREVRARGRFGAVWRAHLDAREVAVKVFPAQERASWLCEQEMYRLPRMAHANVLQFIGVEKRGDNLQAEYWLVTAYHEKGSLCDYLKANAITWEEAWQVAWTMARGLTHLHDEMSPSQTAGRKPAIAHRDFKSKNVLLKSDMSACIADFGLALIFQPGVACGDTHGQVGTRRYMAPEVLEGAINFTRDAFLRIDMYACGLVLWEIATRCNTLGDPGEYMLPFEEEVGAHPSLEEMQEAVVNQKLRPVVPELWRNHNVLQLFCDTMEECWDHDAEARLSASCVMERIGALRRARHSASAHTPLLIENARPLSHD